jgi:hypothetical protein
MVGLGFLIMFDLKFYISEQARVHNRRSPPRRKTKSKKTSQYHKTNPTNKNRNLTSQQKATTRKQPENN